MSASPERRVGRALLVCLMLLAGVPVSAQDDPGARWQALNAEAVEANDRGAYDQGTHVAEQVLALARRGFDNRDPRTLTEVHRVFRRLLTLRGWSHDEANPSLFP